MSFFCQLFFSIIKVQYSLEATYIPFALLFLVVWFFLVFMHHHLILFFISIEKITYYSWAILVKRKQTTWRDTLQKESKTKGMEKMQNAQKEQCKCFTKMSDMLFNCYLFATLIVMYINALDKLSYCNYVNLGFLILRNFNRNRNLLCQQHACISVG